MHNGRVFVYAREYNGQSFIGSKIIAVDAATGAVQWVTPVAKAVLDSWSSPTVDVQNNSVLIGSGNLVYSLDTGTGIVHWATPLNRNVVNASPLAPAELTPGRAFITDFDGFGVGASLYCINTSPFDEAINPYQPGDIVWQDPIGGSSGNTPAYADGVVYVANIKGFSAPLGLVIAFDPSDDAPSRRLWGWSLPGGQGFFGGVAVVDGFVYAASYNPNGSGDNSLLVKLNAETGSLAWTLACERTTSIPIVDGDRVYLSAGLPGFGSAPRVQCFVDQGTSAIKLWDTYADTAGSLLAGGWTHQPVLANGRLFVGTIPLSGGFFGAYTDLRMLDLSLTPSNAGFVIDHRAEMGSSPAICNGRLYSIGPAGLHAIATRGDLCGNDGLVNGRDVQCFINALLTVSPTDAQITLGDFDIDGSLSPADIAGFIAAMGVN